MPLFALAIPVLHSSGAWIAYAGSGYLAGTLSGTWVGAFILGNAGLLSGFGLISAAGIASAAGVLTGFGTAAAAGIGSALTTVGLGGLASWLGIAPAVTFLGLTPVGWAVAGTAVAGGGLLALLAHRLLRRINEERVKGGLEEVTPRQIVREVKEFEEQALREVLTELAREGAPVKVDDAQEEVQIDGSRYSIGRLKYLVNKDGSEELVFVTRLGRARRIFLIRPAGPVPQLT